MMNGPIMANKYKGGLSKFEGENLGDLPITCQMLYPTNVFSWSHTGQITHQRLCLKQIHSYQRHQQDL